MSLSGIGPSSPSGAATPLGAGRSPTAGMPKSAAEEFLEFAGMTPAQRMRAAILAEMGTSEEALAKMGPDERAAVNQEIARRIKDQAERSMEKRAGLILDVAA